MTKVSYWLFSSCLVIIYLTIPNIIPWFILWLTHFISDISEKKVKSTTVSCETQTDLDIFCGKCTEPIEDNDVISKANFGSGKLRVKSEFKLRIQTNGMQGKNHEENDDCLDEDDIDEDEERYAAIMAAAEDSDDEDEGK